MKKIILILAAALLAALTLPAQNARIYSDTASPDGVRTILTFPINCKTKLADKCPMSFALSAAVTTDKTVHYSLDVTYMRVTTGSEICTFCVPLDGRLLIKLDDDSVIELANIRDPEEMKDPVGVASVNPYWDHHITAYYPITSGQLDMISDHAITKIRVQHSEGTPDVEYKSDKAGEAIRAQYALINETLASEEKSFYSDF